MNRTDTFDRANTTNNIGTPSDGGTAWTQLSGTWGITGNNAYESSIASVEMNCVLEANAVNVTVESEFTAITSELGLVVRCVDDNNLLLVVANGGAMTLYKRVAGTYTNISPNEVLTSSPPHLIKATIDSANVLKGYYNGALIVQATVSDHSTATKHGIRANGAVGQFVNFTITDDTASVAPLRKLVKTFVSLAGLATPFMKAANGLYLRDTRIIDPGFNVA